ncbi:MAG: DMT family transporter [Candidatus Krumholzibacteria bacterium]|nr:DMT family transporter [Candidatus Krumholzibacteria bacterium]
MSAPDRLTPLDNMPRAIAWMVLSGLSFALMAAAVKLAGDVPVTMKVFFRNLVTLGITSIVAVKVRENPFGRTPHAKLLILRSLCGLGGVLLYFMALDKLSLADASLLNKTSPFFVLVFAVVLLKEQFDRILVPAVIVAFLGAMLVIKPSFDYELVPAVGGLLSGMFAGLAYILIRALKGRESPNRIIFTFSLVSTLATLPFLIVSPARPTTFQWLALLGTGVFAAGGQYGLTFAYHHARASRISVFTYLHVLFALILGFVIWDERLDAASIVGGLLIVGAAVFTHWSSNRRAATITQRLGGS